MTWNQTGVITILLLMQFFFYFVFLISCYVIYYLEFNVTVGNSLAIMAFDSHIKSQSLFFLIHGGYIIIKM